jgi:hypothetical protein
MKRILLPLIAILILSSCSSSDETPLSEDVIIGQWQLIRQYGENADDCEKKSTIIFEDNFDLIFNTHFTFDTDCVDTGITKGSWSKKNSNLYSFEKVGSYIDVPVRFEDNGKTLVLLDNGEEEFAYSRK